MSEIGDVFAALAERKKLKKKSNIEHSTYLLIDKGFDIDIRNNGAHLIVSHNSKIADFWPSTGKFNIRGESGYGRGVKNLIKKMGG